MLGNLNDIFRAVPAGTAVAALNASTLEGARAAIAAAETLGLPLILQHAQVHERWIPLDLAGPVMLTMAEQAKVPVCVHLDHGSDYDYVSRALRLGFTSIMYDASTKSMDDNLRKTAAITRIAHAMNVTVEAEIGSMAHKGDAADTQNYTDPADARRFAAETGVDALAISFGTVHGIYRTEPKLSVEVVAAVREATGGLPLVMHGGSGVSDDDYRAVIAAGIRKINYYTYGALAGAEAVKALVAEKPDELQFHEVAERAAEAMQAHFAGVMQVFTGGTR